MKRSLWLNYWELESADEYVQAYIFFAGKALVEENAVLALNQYEQAIQFLNIDRANQRMDFPLKDKFSMSARLKLAKLSDLAASIYNDKGQTEKAKIARQNSAIIRGRGFNYILSTDKKRVVG